MTRTTRVLLLTAFAAMLGCSEIELIELPDIPPTTHVDTFFQEREDYADILLVVDNSCSMQDEQDELAANFESFVEFIDVAQTDYHIGVTTTDTDTAIEGYGDLAGRLRGEPHFITRDTPNGAEVFRDAVRVGIGGSGFERGFEAARRALSDERLEGTNEGFYREGALLTLIFVSDEDDQSIAGPICSGNFSQILFEMGQATTRIRDRFPLSWAPLEETVTVHLAVPGTPEFVTGGSEVPPEGLDGGVYAWRLERDLDGWWLRFVDSEQLPPADTRIQVEYELAD